MRYWRQGVLLASVAAFLGQWTLTSGGPLSSLRVYGGEPATMPELPHLTSVPATILAPRIAVFWSVHFMEGQTPAIMSDDGIVGPDGKLEVGPYGAVPVVGLTLDKASVAIARHLAAHVKEPRVTLQLGGPVGPSLGEPGPVVTVGRVVAITNEEPEDAVPTRTVPVAMDPAPLSSGAPLMHPAVTASAPPVSEAIAPPMTGRWQAIETPTPVSNGPAAGNWRPVQRAPSVPYRSSAALHGHPVRTAGGAPEPQLNPANAQPEPPTELKVFPRRVPNDAEPAAPGVDVAAPLPVEPHVFHSPPPVPHETARVSLPPYVIDPPDVLLIESTQKIADQPVRGQHLVRPDGMVSLGIYGSVYVAGLTLDQAKEVIAQQLGTRIKDFEVKNLAVDVLNYNSKFYYVVSDGGGYGEQVIRFPITGSETVLDAISQIGGLGAVAEKKKIWVARAARDHHSQQVLPVDWIGITQHGQVATNYQVMPNDRIYVKAKGLVTLDTAMARFLSPIERIFGITLLGSTTVNSIRTNGSSSGNNNSN